MNQVKQAESIALLMSKGATSLQKYLEHTSTTEAAYQSYCRGLYEMLTGGTPANGDLSKSQVKAILETAQRKAVIDCCFPTKYVQVPRSADVGDPASIPLANSQLGELQKFLIGEGQHADLSSRDSNSPNDYQNMFKWALAVATKDSHKTFLAHLAQYASGEADIETLARRLQESQVCSGSMIGEIGGRCSFHLFTSMGAKVVAVEFHESPGTDGEPFFITAENGARYFPELEQYDFMYTRDVNSVGSGIERHPDSIDQAWKDILDVQLSRVNSTGIVFNEINPLGQKEVEITAGDVLATGDEQRFQKYFFHIEYTRTAINSLADCYHDAAKAMFFPPTRPQVAE